MNRTGRNDHRLSGLFWRVDFLRYLLEQNHSIDYIRRHNREWVIETIFWIFMSAVIFWALIALAVTIIGGGA